MGVDRYAFCLDASVLPDLTGPLREVLDDLFDRPPDDRASADEKGARSPRGMAMVHGYRTAPMLDWFEDLDPPPAENDGDWTACVEGLKARIAFAPGPYREARVAAGADGYAVLSDRIPTFLGDHDERAAEIWKRMIGETSPAEPTLRIGETEYRLKGRPRPPFVQGDDVARLAAGIDAALPEYRAFHRELRGEFGAQKLAVAAHPLLAVRALCATARGRQNGVVGVRTS